MGNLSITYTILLISLFTVGTVTINMAQETTGSRIPVIFDTDANNELDDQHALAYLLLNEGTFDVRGITVNSTRNGGDIDEHYIEAMRIVTLCDLKGKIPVLKGANGSFPEIKEFTDKSAFDGSDAVRFIIDEARRNRSETLVILAVGKLTNVALALKTDPTIADRIRLVWLGSNYPDPGEYNQENDTASMSYLLKTKIPFEMVTVRYGQPSGTAAVKVARHEIYTRMPGLGPVVHEPVSGRHGDAFSCFGDYSVSLFKHITNLEEGCYRSLFDLAAVAIVKDPGWATARVIPCPKLIDNQWVDQPGNDRQIIVWEDFNKEEILTDLYTTLEKESLGDF